MNTHVDVLSLPNEEAMDEIRARHEADVKREERKQEFEGGITRFGCSNC